MPTNFNDFVNDLEGRAAPAQAGLLDAYKQHFEQEKERLFELPHAFAAARRRMGMTQADLSLAAGVQQAEISRIESGQGNPTVDTLTRLAAPLKAHLALVDEEGHVLPA